MPQERNLLMIGRRAYRRGLKKGSITEDPKENPIIEKTEENPITKEP